MLKENNKVDRIETYSTLQSSMNFYENISAQELGEKYLKYFEDMQQESKNIQSNDEKTKETLTKAVAELSIENKKKDVLISQLAQQINSLNVKIQQLGGK